MEASPAIDILLATYNGESFLAEQLDSVFRQTYTHFRILVRDDGSSDNTRQIIEQYRINYPDRIRRIDDDATNLGATQNFARLLKFSDADYTAFCDQDDIWQPDKLETSLAKLKKLETAHPGRPCLVYSDMKLIDESGQLLHESVWKRLHLAPEYFIFNRLLVQNIPHGCTILINRAMRDLVNPIPPEAMLHDHWLALVASALGEHAAIEKPLVLLRNHAQNVTRKKFTRAEKMNRYVENILSDEAYEQIVQARVRQAKAFRERYANDLSPGQLHTLDQFILLGTVKGFRRKWLYLKNGFFRTTFRHTLKMILRG